MSGYAGERCSYGSRGLERGCCGCSKASGYVRFFEGLRSALWGSVLGASTSEAFGRYGGGCCCSCGC